MPRGAKTKTGKQNLLREIAEQLGVVFDDSWLSRGSTITAPALQAILEKIAVEKGVPPNHFEEHEKEILRLVSKSIEAMILALETVNRLSVHYRIETFCFLVCNAWELLLKAKIIDDSKQIDSIYYKQNPNEDKRSFSLRDCLKKVAPNEKDPVRRNIERIADLRDSAVHLLLGDVPQDVLCLFQSCVLNYQKKLEEWFNRSILDHVPAGMMIIAYNMRPDILEVTNLRKKLSKEAAEFITQYSAEIQKEFDDLKRPAEFSIGIEYKLAITKKTDEADIVLSNGPGGTPAHVVEVPKDPSISHPFRQKEVIQTVNNAIPDLTINQYDIQCVNNAHAIKKRSEFFYKGKVEGSPSQYSQSFVDWLLKQHQNDPSFFEKARKKVKTK
ncbi:MAG: hypothetical protein DIKNOCCD_02156 [bacterium]|nr:hypothetical protein [bacterium]